MFYSVRPQRRQPTWLPRPWDSPGKNTGVGCHFLLQYMKVKSESEVAQSCLTPSDPMGRSLPGSSVHETCQARVLEWGAIAVMLLKKKKKNQIPVIFKASPKSIPRKEYWELRHQDLNHGVATIIQVTTGLGIWISDSLNTACGKTNMVFKFRFSAKVTSLPKQL